MGRGAPPSLKPQTAKPRNSKVMKNQYPSQFLELPNEKMVINLFALQNNNILDVRYIRNGNHHPSFKVQRISQNLSNTLQDILHKRFDERLVKLLRDDEKEILKEFIRIGKFPLVLDKAELDEFNKNYDVLLGEYRAGNNNPQLIRSLINHIRLGYKLGRIRKTDAMSLILQLEG